MSSAKPGRALQPMNGDESSPKSLSSKAAKERVANMRNDGVERVSSVGMTSGALPRRMHTIIRSNSSSDDAKGNGTKSKDSLEGIVSPTQRKHPLLALEGTSSSKDTVKPGLVDYIKQEVTSAFKTNKVLPPLERSEQKPDSHSKSSIEPRGEFSGKAPLPLVLGEAEAISRSSTQPVNPATRITRSIRVRQNSTPFDSSIPGTSPKNSGTLSSNHKSPSQASSIESSDDETRSATSILSAKSVTSTGAPRRRSRVQSISHAQGPTKTNESEIAESDDEMDQNVKFLPPKRSSIVGPDAPTPKQRKESLKLALKELIVARRSSVDGTEGAPPKSALKQTNIEALRKESHDPSTELPISILKNDVLVRTRYLKGWKLCYKRLEIARTLSHEFKAASQRVESYRILVSSNARQAFDFLTRFHLQKADALLSSRVLDLLESKDRDASSEKLEKLLRLRLKNVSSYSLDQRLQFCRVMEYIRLDSNRVVVKEGHKANAFYFILSGQVEIFKMVNEQRCSLRLLVAGDSFGDRSMYAIDDLRTASVETVSESELLSVDKREFIKITKTFDARIKADRLAKMAEIPEFKHFNSTALEKIPPFCSFSSYEAQKPIMMEDAHIFEIFWILSGTCRCVKVVPFIKRTSTKQGAGEAPIILPYSEAKHLQEKDEVVRELLSIHDIPTGSHFPNMPVPDNLHFDVNPDAKISRDDYILLLKGMDNSEKQNKCPVSVLTNERVEVMYMSRLEFVEVVTADIITETIKSNAMTEVPMAELQDLFINKLKWDIYKKKVTDEVHSQKSSVR